MINFSLYCDTWVLGVWWILHFFHELPALRTVMPGTWPEAVTGNLQAADQAGPELVFYWLSPWCSWASLYFKIKLNITISKSHGLLCKSVLAFVAETGRWSSSAEVAAGLLWSLEVLWSPWGDWACVVCFVSPPCLLLWQSFSQPLLKRGERESWLKITSCNKYLLFMADSSELKTALDNRIFFDLLVGLCPAPPRFEENFFVMLCEGFQCRTPHPHSNS